MKSNFSSGQIAVTFIVVVLFIGIISNKGCDSGTATPQKAPITNSEKNNAVVKIANWQYDESVDIMDNTTTYKAINDSPDKLNFEFPYDGGSSISLHIRKKGNDLDMYFAVSKGQFQTNNRYARLKFDDHPPIKIYLLDAADGSSEYAFIQNPQSTLAKIKKSSVLLAELPFYQAGSRQASFDISNLKWNH